MKQCLQPHVAVLDWTAAAAPADLPYLCIERLTNNVAAASVASATCGSTPIPSTPQRENKKGELREVGEEEDIFHDKWTSHRERSSLQTRLTQMKGKIVRLILWSYQMHFNAVLCLFDDAYFKLSFVWHEEKGRSVRWFKLPAMDLDLLCEKISRHCAPTGGYTTASALCFDTNECREVWQCWEKMLRVDGLRGLLANPPKGGRVTHVTDPTRREASWDRHF